MSESEQVEAHVPITVTIDVDQLLRSELGWSVYDAGGEPGYAPGGNGRIIDVVAMKLAGAIEEEARTAVREAVRAKALEKVDGLVEEVMSGTIRLTTEYGEAKSPDMTMREAMIKAMTDRLEEKVDDQGKPLSNDRYNRSYDRGFSYLQWRATKMSKDILDKELSGQLSDAAKTIRDKAKTMVSQKIADVLGSSL